ncbi:MAG: signal peptidase I [Actinomycetaceae bacterium]|nr:signal peptidase I [Actinomycetaceae bacterium]
MVWKKKSSIDAKGTEEVSPQDEVKHEKVSAQKAEKKKPSLLNDFVLLVFKIILIVAAVASLFLFVFGFHRVNSSGMEPRIRGNDVIFYYRLPASYSQSDVVVVNYEGATMLGRIIASEGDEVDIDDKGLKVNGNYQAEGQYVKGETTQVEGGVDFPLTVPENSYFILGDSREDAIDSRIYGCVSEGDIYGTVIIQMRRADF